MDSLRNRRMRQSALLPLQFEQNRAGKLSGDVTRAKSHSPLEEHKLGRNEEWEGAIGARPPLELVAVFTVYHYCAFI